MKIKKNMKGLTMRPFEEQKKEIEEKIKNGEELTKREQRIAFLFRLRIDEKK